MTNVPETDSRSVPTDMALAIAGMQQALFAYVFVLVPNAADAEDILQNTNRTILSKIDRARHVECLPAWCKRVAYFEVLAFRKNRSRDRHVFAGDSVLLDQLAADSPPDSAGGPPEMAVLDHCRAALKESDQSLLKHRYTDNLSATEIAARINTTEGTVRQRLHRIRPRLLQCVRRRLRKSGETS